MRPEFGCAVHDYVFAPADAGTAGDLAYAVRVALDRWEPRIELEEVQVQPRLGSQCRALDVRPRPIAARQRALVEGEAFDCGFLKGAPKAGEGIEVVEDVEVALVLAHDPGHVQPGRLAGPREGYVSPLL